MNRHIWRYVRPILVGAATLIVLGASVSARAQNADGQQWVDLWGPAIGTQAPTLSANDHRGTPRDLNDLAGEQGLLLIFNRSVDW